MLPRCPTCNREARTTVYCSSVLTSMAFVACPRGCAIAEARTEGDAQHKWRRREFSVRRKARR